MKISLFKIFGISMLMGMCFISGQTVVAKDNNKEKKIKVKILQNTSTKQCNYLSNVTIEVKYKKKNFTGDMGTILLEASDDSVIYYQVQTKDVEAGKGSTLMSFDAGNCTQDIRVSIQ